MLLNPFNVLWCKIYGTEDNDEDGFRKGNTLSLEFFPSTMKPRCQWESKHDRSRCSCCERKWSTYIVKCNCSFCGRLVCGSHGCSLINVTVKSRCYEPWLRTCKPCWHNLVAIIRSGEAQSWEIAKTYVLLDGELDNDYEANTEMVENASAGEIAAKHSVQSTSASSAVELVSRSTSPIVDGCLLVSTVFSSPGSSENGLEVEVQRLKLEIQHLLSAKADLEQTLTELLARAGNAHIKRDWRRLNNPSQFPAGNDLKEAFQVSFFHFEKFAGDVVTSLVSMGHAVNAADMLVSQIMKPMYDVAYNYVIDLLNEKEAAMYATFSESAPTDLTHDTITKLFWFTRMQEVVPKLISNLSEEVIVLLMREMGDLVPAVHAQMLDDTENDLIDSSENNLRIPQVVRTLLQLFAYAMLSDPNCYLQPTPGTTVAYHPDRCNEILSPGTRKLGQIKEGDEVEVVLCGLYFQDTASEEGAFERVRPVVKCCVRRNVIANHRTSLKTGAHN